MKRFMLALAGATLAAAGVTAQAQNLAAGKAAFDKAGCAVCHGADAKTPILPEYPVLAGQYADYLVLALRAYKRGAAEGNHAVIVRKNATMGVQIATLKSDQEIRDIAAWLSSLPSDLSTRH